MRFLRSHLSLVALAVVSLQLAGVMVPSAVGCCTAVQGASSAEKEICDCPHDRMPDGMCPMHKQASRAAHSEVSCHIQCADSIPDALPVSVIACITPRFTLSTAVSSSEAPATPAGRTLNRIHPPLSPPPRG